jgi:hypothetical protein
MLSREEMQRGMRGPIKIVNVPEWGGDVGIKKLTAADLIYLRSLAKKENSEATSEENLRAIAEVLARTLCDTDGVLCFTVDELQEWAGDQMSLMYRLVDEVQLYNGMTVGQKEDLSKNSESGPTSVST